MTPADLRTLMATAERQPGETTEQLRARASAEGTLTSWRAWLPALLESVAPAGWRERGDRDPHHGQYDCEREALCGGHLTDDQVAYQTAMLMRGDLNHEGVLCTAKDRIRWLSRRLAILEAASATAAPRAEVAA